LLIIFCLFSIITLFLSMYSLTTDTYTLSLHDALPIYRLRGARTRGPVSGAPAHARQSDASGGALAHDPRPGPLPDVEVRAHLERSEEHTSELQSRENLVCRLLLEKKKRKRWKKSLKCA